MNYRNPTVELTGSGQQEIKMNTTTDSLLDVFYTANGTFCLRSSASKNRRMNRKLP